MKGSTAVRIASLIVSLVLFGCSMPYRNPTVEEPGSELSGGTTNSSFSGLSQLISSKQPIKVLWTHGMCSTDYTWAESRARALAKALGGTVTQMDLSSVSPSHAYRVPVTITTDSGSLNVDFLVWSPLTTKYKQKLLFDNPVGTAGGRNPYKRASLNRDLKISLINDCFSDAIVYAGTNGAPIRQFMLNQVCTALDGTLGRHGHCNLATAQSPSLVLIGESLGSKMLIDAIETIWHDYASPRSPRHPFLSRLRARIASIQMVFLLANQIPLLDLAGTPPSGSDAADAAAAPSSVSQFAQILSSSLPATANHERAERSIVAFTDPNDLLSYRLLLGPPEFAGVRLINVIVSNDYTYFGYVERPDKAHTDYGTNDHVMSMLAHGYSNVGSLPSSVN